MKKKRKDKNKMREGEWKLPEEVEEWEEVEEEEKGK